MMIMMISSGITCLLGHFQLGVVTFSGWNNNHMWDDHPQWMLNIFRWAYLNRRVLIAIESLAKCVLLLKFWSVFSERCFPRLCRSFSAEFRILEVHYGILSDGPEKGSAISMRGFEASKAGQIRSWSDPTWLIFAGIRRQKYGDSWWFM